MKNRYILPFIFIAGTVLFGVSGENFGISDLIQVLKSESSSWHNNQAIAKAAFSQYRSSKSALYPSINGNLPLTYSGYENVISIQGIPGITETEGNEKGNSFSAGPEISLTQLLPTAGILSASAGNNILMSRISDQEPMLPGTSTDPRWSNTTSLSAALAQPLYFGGAYEAAKTTIEKTLESSLSSVLDNKNQLVIAAVSDYYSIKQSIYSLELIKIRLEKERENYRRVEREFEMGLWTKSILYQARSILLQSETDLLEAEQLLEAKTGLFSATYGFSETPAITPEVSSLSKPGINMEEILGSVYAANTESVQLRNAIELQNAAIIISKKDNAPTLSLGGSWSLNNGLGDNDDDSGSSFSLSLGLNASIYDGGSHKHSIDKMYADLESYDSALAARMIQLENQTVSLIDSIERAEQLGDLYLLQEEAARYEYDRGILDFDLGQITKKELSELHLALENVLLTVQQNRINTNIYYLQLLALQGEDLSEAEILNKT